MCPLCSREHSAVDTFCDDCIRHIENVRYGLPVVIDEYRDVRDFPNYEIGDDGYIRNKKTHKEIKHLISKTGHHSVSLKTNNKSTIVGIARLVAAAWLPEYRDGYKIIHINGDFDVNEVSNLEMSTHTIKHARKWKL